MMTTREDADIHAMLAEIVRDSSRSERLISGEDLLACLEARGFPGKDKEEAPDIDRLMAETLAANADLAAMASISGKTLYHAPALLSRTYASILDRRDTPVVLIAEEVRRNSADYPRAIPVDLFETPPFDLTPAQIETALRSMASNPEFQDITYTTTSTGTVYLFSSLHLERDYAAFLAERADVGLLFNP
jgi:hypothetical protein